MNRAKTNNFIFGAMHRLRMDNEDRYAIVQEVTGQQKGLTDCTDKEIGEIRTWFENALKDPADIAATKLKDDRKKKMIMKLLSHAYTMQWAEPRDWKKAKADISSFCESPKGLFKKPLDSHNIAELTQVVSQFDEMVKKHYKTVGK